MMPVIAWNVLHAAGILTAAMSALRVRSIEGLGADAARCRELLDRSTAVATALSPYLGYAATAEIAKESVAGRGARFAIWCARAASLTRRCWTGSCRLRR